MMLQSVLERLAAAGLAGKAAAGGAAVVLATSAGGVADALPAPAQDAFDRLVATEAVEVEEVDDVDVDVVQEGLDDDVQGEATEDDVTEDGEDAGSFGARVSEDARDGGVSGADIACAASQGRSGLCEEEPAEADVDGEDEADGEDERATMEGFGEDVSEDARDGGVDGQEVSRMARERNPGVATGPDARD